MRYLFELGCEEIPARYLNPIMILIETRLREASLAHYINPVIQLYSTPRRLAFLLSDLPLQTDPREQLIMGPPVAIAYQSDGELSPAGHAFLKRNNANASQLLTEKTDGKERIAIKRLWPSQPISGVLVAIVHTVFDSLPLPVAMNWGVSRGPFIRPIQWVVSILDTMALPLFQSSSTLGSIQLDPEVLGGALDHSRGHRWLTGDGTGSGAWVPIPVAHAYEEVLREASVCVDPMVRRSAIVNALPIPSDELDPDLLDELVGLCEFPTVISAWIPDEFSALPDAPVVECIRKNQKYITWRVNGRLNREYWICVDGLTDQNRDQVAKGNESVLRARLNDVLFFWNEDRRHPLNSRVPKLDWVVYQEGLGSLGDKVRRLKKITNQVAAPFLLDPTQRADLQRATELCKADLLSGMVQELPALQGIMGGLYATYDGETDGVANAISTLYQLVVPTESVAAILWMADRLDTVASCFVNGLIPTGSQDPWGVRRAALGVVMAVLTWCPSVSLSDVMNWSLDEFEWTEPIRSQLGTFYLDRFRYILIHHYGLDVDLVQMVTHRLDRGVGDSLELAQSLQEWRRSNPLVLKRVAELAIRVHRLATHYTPGERVALPANDLNWVTPILDDLSQSPTLTHIAHWPPRMDSYFEAVMMMDEDPQVRAARLGFLYQLSDCLASMGDWEKVVVS